MTHDADTVFDSAQLSIHFSEQIYDVMRAYKGEGSKTIHDIANPNIPRIKAN